MTIIATSLDITHPRKQSILKRRDELLESVKSVMISETFDDNMSIETLLATAGVNEEEYYEALKIAKKGNVVVLKRSPKEIWINNYNEEWLTAWNGNLDLQICTDIFAVVTYITDYCAKDETGVLEILIKEWKKSENEEFKKKCHKMKDVFLTHRKMGEVEAYYRILPSLHLVESTSKCQFVTSGNKYNINVNI
jgi:hypothetical protein